MKMPIEGEEGETDRSRINSKVDGPTDTPAQKVLPSMVWMGPFEFGGHNMHKPSYLTNFVR